MPEIDGLRFIAIASVLLFHLRGFIIAKDGHSYADSIDYSWLTRLLSRGDLGVPLFFVISGFILGMPFAKYYLAGEKPVSLRKYFARRLTRLEPPYILAMTILLFGAVFVAGSISLHNGVLSYLASIFYSHNFIYGRDVLPYLNGVAWSLEIEIQFYVLAPLMACLFAIKSPSTRRLTLAGTALLFLVFNHVGQFPVRNIIDWLQYFLVGFLLVDLHVSKSMLLPRKSFDTLIAICFFTAIWAFKTEDFRPQAQKFLWETIQLACIFGFYYYVIIHNVCKFLSTKIVTNIGGMCYTIYLLHYPIISLFGNYLVNHSFSRWSFINIGIYSLLLLVPILAISSVFFLLIERPCMDKDWVRKLFKGKGKKAEDLLGSTPSP